MKASLNLEYMKPINVRPLAFSLAGIVLLLPATYFLIALLLRVIFGSTTLYYSIAPSFLESTYNWFSFQKSVWILYGPFVAAFLNLFVILKIQIFHREGKTKFRVLYRNNGLSIAIALQGILLFLVLVAYVVIQHYRY